MKIFKKILLSILCIVILSLIAFTGYRMILSEAKIVPNEKNGYSSCIEYNGKKYYGNICDSALPDNYYSEDVNEERLTYCRDGKPVSFITFSIYGIGDNSDMLFFPNYGVLGPSVGWIYIREDYVFPTVQNSEVAYIELGFHPEESIFLYDEETINKVVDCIKIREDISEIISIEKYGNYKLYVHYKDAPVYEQIGGIWAGKYMYEDEYWAWTETDEFWEWVESN